MVQDITVAIVDGYSTGRILTERLWDAGVRCLHVRSQPDVNSYLLRGFDPSRYQADILFDGDPEAVAGQLKTAGVTQVVAGSESGVILTDILNDMLGLPGNLPDRSLARRDKSLMADVLARAGIAVPRGQLCHSANEAVDWFLQHNLAEVVLKPVKSSGTDNVFFCSELCDIREAANTILASRDVFGVANTAALIQERLVGTEYYLNTVSREGSHKMAEIWRYAKRSGPAGAPLYDFEEPVTVASSEWRLVATFARSVLDSLGVRTGAAHIEVILTQAGLVHIETGARLCGVTAPDVVERYSGISQTALLATSLIEPGAFDSFVDDHTVWQAQVRHVSLINHTAGLAREPHWIKLFHQLPSVVRVASFVVPGTELPVTADLIGSPGFVYLAAADPADIDRDYRALRAMEYQQLYTAS